MAITLSAPDATSAIRIRFHIKDHRGQTDTVSLLVGSGTTDTQIENIINDYDQLTNAQLVSVDVETITKRLASGMKSAAVDAVYDLISVDMVLAFEGPNPINAARSVRRPVPIPAYVRSKAEVSGLSGKPNSSDTQMAQLITILNSQMAILGDDGTYYVGNLAAVDADGNAISVGDIIDAI